MDTIQLHVDVNLEDIMHQLSFCDHEDIFNFIKALDLQVADWDFTEELYDYFADQMYKKDLDGD